MNQSLNDLAGRIRSELEDLRRVVERAQHVWQRSKISVVDNSKPTGAEWHRELLKQMSAEIATARPAVVSEGTQIKLDEYLRFRHLVRNVYTFKLDAGKMSELVENSANLYQQVYRELSTFADFLEQRARDTET